MPPDEKRVNFHLPDLDSDPTRPRYQKIADLLRRQILAGRVRSGDLLPSELQLCRRYAVSRTTVRQALQLLVEENRIERRRGKGSFVSEKKLSRQLSHLYSFTEDMQALGRKPHSRVLSSEVRAATAAIAAALGLSSQEHVFYLQRLRLASEDPILLENTYLPYALVKKPDIARLDFAQASLYEALRQTYQLRLAHAIETYEATFLTTEQAELFGCEPGLPAFRIRRIAYLENEEPFELTEAIARGDKCKFQVDLQTRQKKIGFSRQITP